MSNSEEEGGHPPRKRKLTKQRNNTKKASKFAPENYMGYFDDEAYESDVEDDEQIKKPSKGEVKYKDRTIPEFMYIENNDVEKYFKEKEKEIEIREENQYFTPSSKDPTIYAVEVFRKKQQDLVLQILNKAACLKDTDDKLNISSVSFFEKNPGIIFIESFKLSSVMEALDGLTGIISRKFEVVKMDYYTEVFAPRDPRVRQFKPNSFVRIKSGLYQGDLARVIQAKVNGRAKVEVVPRIDPAEIESLHNQGKHREITKIIDRSKYVGGMPRPERRLIFQGDLPKIPQLQKLTLIDNGLLELRLPSRQLTAFSKDAVKYSELKYFRGREDNEEPMEFMKSKLQNIEVMTKFEIGQKIKVVNGVYEGVKGEIQGVDEGNHLGRGAKLLIKPRDKAMQPFEITPYQVTKFFKERDHVKVVGGRHEGKTGIILTIKDSNATILTLNGNQVEVLINQLTLSSGEKHEQSQSNSLHRYDLIKLSDGMGPACVLMNEKDTLKVLDQHNSSRLINMLDMQQKIDTRNNYAKNSLGQEIRRGAVVRIRQGPKAGKKCEVKHVFKDILFLYNSQFYNTSSIYADICTNVTLVSASEAVGRIKRGAVEDFEVGGSVVVKAGEWKGYQGVIKEVGKDNLMIRLVAKCKTVQVRKDMINEKSQIGKTPLPAGGQTAYRSSPGPANTPSRLSF